MKRFIPVLSIVIILVLGLSSCGQSYTLSTDGITAIAMRQSDIQITLTDPQEVAAMIAALNSLGFTKTNPSQEEISTSLYTVTLYADQKAKETISLFSDNLIQIGTSYYSGDFDALFTCLETHFFPTFISEISPIFQAPFNKVSEVAMHDHTNGTYKITTDTAVIHEILNEFRQTHGNDTVLTGELNKEFTFYFRIDGESAYASPVHVYTSQTETIQVITCESKALRCNPYRGWSALYGRIAANPMPIVQ